ncbi:arsenosugar biosynthesis arsenite methyltransferase ArsM [Synechococcus sp. PCC 6312]|uniref:arsenosugar biosynthesis arsenite methyltransferase ArsM n=1 Tax=Synechococcus sp. (strain ATCC 27167 / PCC 6312) TaxID=195253 RepID=UPI00029F376C|nr:arsenosugar biosynthesis arsenite methyltransferase ArsM [Synechococcus sp. PCC 6312]AFY60984.1 methylase involved in ubiquinone/menaquinone biosynthesis [Synechococcus sp. PCC 6312]
MSYLDTAAEFYATVAQTPDIGLCCVNEEIQALPDLVIPDIMQAMNYGCGTTVQASELANQPTVLYVGVGGGLEALQFAYFARRPGAVIAVDPVAEMREAAQRNLVEAARLNPWFDPAFVQICAGDAFHLPLAAESVDVVAQNCLFNIFEPTDLALALKEAARVLKPQGRLLMSDPITTIPIPEHLRQDERLRAMCLSGALTYAEYIQHLAQAGFGQIEIRARRPYRVLDQATYHLDHDIALDSLDSVAIKTPVTCGGPKIIDLSADRAVISNGQAPKCCG